MPDLLTLNLIHFVDSAIKNIIIETMKFKDLEEQLYNLYCNSEFEKTITIARKEFLNGNREIFIYTFLSDAYCSIEKFKKRGMFLSKIALDLINEARRSGTA